MNTRYVFSSLTRISPLADIPFLVSALRREHWDTGDYVVCEIADPPEGHHHIELSNGRMMPIMQGDLIVGALGKRKATLEATGTWRTVADDGRMHVLTRAGLFGKVVSKSPFTAPLIELQYQGHVMLHGTKATMQQFVEPVPPQLFQTPVILLVGTSMSAGKTTSARIIVRMLKNAGKRVLGAKLAGAGRLRDILGMADAGADQIFDFVDVGLPSTICPEDEYRQALAGLLARMAGADADVAVVEIGSSPLEPYNGDVAIAAIQEHIRSTVLCASDPYAVLGVMNAFKMYPSFVSGPATNTRAGIELIEKLCGVRALNLLDPESLPLAWDVLVRELTAFAAASVA